MQKSVLLLLMAAALSAAGQNLLENPSFEIQQEQNSALPEKWDVLKRGSYEETHALESSLVYDGQKAVRITNGNVATASAQLIWIQRQLGEKLKQLPVGTSVEFSVMATAVDKPCTARIYFESSAAKKTFLKAEKLLPGKWTRITTRFTRQDVDYGSPYVCLQLIGNGSAVFDCAYLGEAGQNPWSSNKGGEVIFNGDLEKCDENGIPLGWSKLQGNSGKATVSTSLAASGTKALQLTCAETPKGMLAWKLPLSGESFEGIAPGTPMVLSLNANCGGNPATKFRVYVEFRKGSQFIGTFILPNQSVYAGWDRKELKFKMPKEAPTSANVFIQLQTAGTVTVDDLSLKKAADAPQAVKKVFPENYCRIASPMPAGNNCFFPSVPKELSIEFILPEQTLDVELWEIDGEKIAGWHFDSLTAEKKGEASVTLPASLPKTAYELRFSSGNWKDYEWFRICDRESPGTFFNENGILMLDGKEFFPIGILTPASNLDALRVYSASGINLLPGDVLSSEVMADYTLTTLQRYQLACFSWNSWGLRDKVEPAELRERLKKQAAFLQKRHGFVGFLTDEAPWCRMNLESIRRDYRFYYKYLPYVMWLNNAPRMTGDPSEPRQSFDSVRAYTRASDVSGCDIYPVPEGPGHNNLDNETISCVGEYTELCRKLTWGRKPVWMVLQAMGWSEENGQPLDEKRPRPTEKQLRFMVWNAITHGATGIFWYGAGAKDVYSEWWRGFARVNRELSAISRMMLQEKPERLDALEPRLAGIKGKGFRVIVNEDPRECATYEGHEIEAQGVLFLTDEPLAVETPARFVPEKQSPTQGKRVSEKVFLINGEWVAHPDRLREKESTVCARQSFQLETLPERALLRVSADDEAELFLNGRKIGKVSSHTIVHEFDVTALLKKGENQLTLTLYNESYGTGIVFEIAADKTLASSGKETFFSLPGQAAWVHAATLGRPPVKPWGAPSLLIRH